MVKKFVSIIIVGLLLVNTSVKDIRAFGTEEESVQALEQNNMDDSKDSMNIIMIGKPNESQGNWEISNDKSYFKKAEGEMACNEWILSDGKWYFLNENGAMASNQWVLSNGKWYFVTKSGAMASNQWVLSRGKWYFVTKSGAMASNQWVLSRGKWYFVTKSGVMASNQWVLSNGTWYFLAKSGVMLSESWVLSKNSWYYLTKSGAMKIGWLNQKGKTYFLTPDTGKMVCDQQILIDGYLYFFNSDGVVIDIWGD